MQHVNIISLRYIGRGLERRTDRGHVLRLGHKGEKEDVDKVALALVVRKAEEQRELRAIHEQILAFVGERLAADVANGLDLQNRLEKGRGGVRRAITQVGLACKSENYGQTKGQRQTDRLYRSKKGKQRERAMASHSQLQQPTVTDRCPRSHMSQSQIGSQTGGQPATLCLFGRPLQSETAKPVTRSFQSATANLELDSQSADLNSQRQPGSRPLQSLDRHSQLQPVYASPSTVTGSLSTVTASYSQSIDLDSQSTDLRSPSRAQKCGKGFVTVLTRVLALPSMEVRTMAECVLFSHTFTGVVAVGFL